MATSPSSKRKVTFSLPAPEALSVALVGSFKGWDQNPTALKRLKSGVWKTTLSLAPGTYEYRFLVDGQWADDPACSRRVPNPFGAENCVRVVD
jgi:1,4-alpha-glucan branching enzyme